MSNINTATRRKQWMIAGLTAAVALALGGGIWGYSRHQADLKAPLKPKTADMTGLITSSFTDTLSSSVLTQQQNKTAGLENSVSQLKADLKQQNDTLNQKLGKIDDLLNKLQSQSDKPLAANANGTTTTPAGPGTSQNGVVPVGPVGPAQWNINAQNRGPTNGQGSQFYPSTGTMRTGGLKSSTFSYASLQAKKTKLPWIPSGSFSEAVMIEGADANASVTGQQNTSPVVITLIGDVSMPNGKTYNMDQCRVTGEIWGDISSERGEVRTKNISCIMKNGKHIDMAFEGHVAYMGKQGIRGKPVMRNGKIIGYAGAAGLLSGFGEGIKSAATPSVGLGATASVGAGDIFKQGIGGGASKAADTLSQYWIKRAEQYHPIIDIGAGNRVTVVFQQGFRLETIEDAEVEKEKKETPQATVQQASAAGAAQATDATRAAILNPDDVLRQASQLKLGDTIN
ncbi:F-type conjugal transfer pilus assembly protein TraB [Acerihabitans sp. TG2]|uniref:F-type conjugal transfer pilus assembly protein TraB n=1 Tax=Acerihabitans sp. TG2 TaxID=3096008 RepID=UPI002B227E8F|nr:F-type conjugal transfer pilus assembly protein TraB [Acerihabitans sp. TG2]MEA9392688.1 F-type conjugal transfer pilus assembly protein TraB [Acerihabitans sp. TG2]